MTATLLTLAATTGHPTIPDVGVFAVAAAMILAGAVGVVAGNAERDQAGGAAPVPAAPPAPGTPPAAGSDGA